MNKKEKIITIATASIVTAALIFFCIYFVVSNRALAKENHDLRLANNYSNVLAPPPIPETLEFAGESVPLDDPFVYESFDRELISVCFSHSSTLLCLKRSGRWFPMIERVLREEGLPEDFKYLCVTESSLSNAISSAKAVGFWQFLSETAKSYGLEVTDEVDERYNVEKATRAAGRYLKGAYKTLGTWTLAAAGYNMGVGGANSNIKKQSTQTYWDTYFNPETARYVYRILAYKTVFENPLRYGVKIEPDEKYVEPQVKEIVVDKTIPDFYQFCKEKGITYKQLKLLNPWLRSTKLTVAPGKSYKIQIPAK